MTLQKARRLKPGDEIEWRSKYSWAKARSFYKGVVLFVTERGGIRVRRPSGELDWAPYHCVYAWNDSRA